jgi:hypothetical protein
VPALLGIVILSNTRLITHFSWLRRVFIWSVRGGAIILGLVPFMLLWGAVNRGHYGQSGFLTYLYMADRQVPTLRNWLLDRWNSVCNTLVPLNLFLLNRSNPSVNSVDGESPSIIQFYFQYWSTLPFGAGITYFAFLLKFIWIGFIRARAWLMLVFVAPFTIFTIYWGAASTGLLREGLHPWIIGLMIFSVVMWKMSRHHNVYSRSCCVALLLRGIETMLMLVLPSVVTRHKLIETQFAPSDTVALLVMTASTTWLYLTTFRHAWFLSVEKRKHGHRAGIMNFWQTPAGATQTTLRP